MTRPLVPRAPKLQGVQPVAPWVALAVLGVGIATSAGAGLYVSDGASGSAAAGKSLGPSGSVALVMPAAGADRAVVPAAAVASGHSVQIVNFAYAPQVITVSVGDSITWTNQDEAPHTVTTTSGPQSISSPMLSKGQSFTFTFSAPGTYSYYCAVHPDMRAQVVVNPAPAAPSTSSAPSVTTKPSAPAAVSSSTHSAAPATTHSAAPSTTHSDHAASSSTAGAPPVSSMSSMSSMPPASPASSAPPASSGTSSAAAPAVAPTSSASSAAPAPAPAATDAAALPASAAGTTHPVNPTLVLAGLTAGATVYCLLLVASRRPRPETGSEDDEGS